MLGSTPRGATITSLWQLRGIKMKRVEEMDKAIDKLNAEIGDLGLWSPPALFKLHDWIREVDNLIRKEFTRRAATHHSSPRR